MRVIEVQKMWAVLIEEEEKTDTPRVTPRPESVTVVEVYDHTAKKHHFAKWHGGSHGEDYLPGGALYLADTWDDAMKALGVRS